MIKPFDILTIANREPFYKEFHNENDIVVLLTDLVSFYHELDKLNYLDRFLMIEHPVEIYKDSIITSYSRSFSTFNEVKSYFISNLENKKTIFFLLSCFKRNNYFYVRFGYITG